MTGNSTEKMLSKMIDVNSPVIFINDHDFVRIDDLIQRTVGKHVSIIEWNPGTYTTNFRNKETAGMIDNQSLSDFLKEKYYEPFGGEQYLVLKEIHSQYDDPCVTTLLELIAQRRLYDPTYNTTIVIVDSQGALPPEIEKYISRLDIPFPDDTEIKRLINEHIEINGYDKSKFTEKDAEKLLPTLKGLTAFEIDRMLDIAMSSNGTLSAEDKDMILVRKKQMVRNSGVLELIDTPEKIEDIGGLDTLKTYLRRKAKVMEKLTDAQKFGVSIPKGVFIVGMPGCGKSLCAKASAALFDVPLLKLDMGSLMGKYLGQSEENLRKAIRIAEAAAPCVLWIDEIEKGFSGIGGNGDSSLTRMFGYFLSWLQDKTSGVYVIATANNASNLPPELKRKGRFDEIFCVNLPNDSEREKIFEVHVAKKKKRQEDWKKIKESTEFRKLIEKTKGFNGADIEAVVNEAIEECFLSSIENGKTSLNVSDLIKIADATISITKSCKAQIESMERIFKESSFKDASK